MRQGSRTVSEYIREGERLTVLCEINEPEEMKIGRFLSGLREDMREKIEVMQNLTYEGACNSALILEKSARRRAAQPAHTLNRGKEFSSFKPPAQKPSINNRTAAQSLPSSKSAQSHNASSNLIQRDQLLLKIVM